jgi:integrase
VKLRPQYPKTYGKVQSANPGRWLTHEEAYGRLISACQDGSALAVRDELAIRLGLAGMRVTEIASLNIGDLLIDGANPSIQWTGKRRKPRKLTPGPSLIAVIRLYLIDYELHLGTPPAKHLPLVCPGVPRGYAIRWGERINNAPRSLGDMVIRRAKRAGLGHVAPHDLRRSAAGILHNATTDQGAHHFDLLDIQKVLGHSDPATTMRSYLDPMDTGILRKAAHFLD